MPGPLCKILPIAKYNSEKNRDDFFVLNRKLMAELVDFDPYEWKEFLKGSGIFHRRDNLEDVCFRCEETKSDVPKKEKTEKKMNKEKDNENKS